MTSSQAQSPSPQWTGAAPALKRLLHALSWGEVFILLGLHYCWILCKSWPVPAENTWAAVAAVGQFGVMAFVGLLAFIPRFRAALLRIEWLLHLSASLLSLVLLVTLTADDPFDAFVPFGWTFYLWSLCVGFILLANLAAHTRYLGERAQSPDAPAGWRIPFAGLGLWACFLLLAGVMSWPPYFWMAAIILHAAQAPASIGANHGCCVTRKLPFFDRVSLVFEGLTLATLLLAAQLRIVFTCNHIGTLEVKYIDFLIPYHQPLFFVGAALFLLAARLRLAGVSHALIIGTLVLGPQEAAWPIALAMGYGLTALFRTTSRQCPFSFSVTAALLTGVWILGFLGFGVAGVVIDMGMGLGFAKDLVARVRILVPALFAVWGLLVSIAIWNRKGGKEASPEPRTLPAAGTAVCGLLYAVIAAAVLAPSIWLIAAKTAPPQAYSRPGSIAVGEPAGACHAGYSGSDEEYAILHKLGVGIMRVDFHWRGIEPEPGKWSFDRWDSYIEAAERNGVDVLALLDFDNNHVETGQRAKENDGDDDRYIAPEDIPLFLEYVKQTVTRYKDRVYAWEIWNEPDIPRFWTGTPEEFYELTRRTAETVHAIDPDIRIVGPAATSPLGVRLPGYVEGLHASGALDCVDHPSFHLYISDPRGYFNEYMRIVSAARRFGHPGAPWVTEIGDPDGGNYPWRASSELLAEHVIKAHTVATSVGVDKVVWYCLRDSGLASILEEPSNSEKYFGIITRENEWKPAAHAYELFQKHCTNSTIRSDLLEVSGGLAAKQLRSTLYCRDNGECTLILWYEPMLRPNSQARVRFDLGSLDGPAYLNDIGSAYTKVAVDKVVEVTERPVVITFKRSGAEQPITLRASSTGLDAILLLLLGMGVLVSAGVTAKALGAA